MINYNWNVLKLLTENINDKSDYVVIAGYEVIAIEETLTSSTGFLAVQFSTEQVGVFIPYEDLTEEIVIGWIKETLGESEIYSIEESLARQIEHQKNPPPTPQVTPLPW